METTRDEPVKLSDIRRVFYVPGRPGIIDAVHPRTGRGLYGNRTLAEIQAEYPGAVEEDFDVAGKANDDFYRAGPVRITEERFTEMLEVLPPVHWTRTEEGESFKISERTSGNITAIFCRIGGRYFELSDDIRLPHAEIVDRCVRSGL